MISKMHRHKQPIITFCLEFWIRFGLVASVNPMSDSAVSQFKSFNLCFIFFFSVRHDGFYLFAILPHFFVFLLQQNSFGI